MVMTLSKTYTTMSQETTFGESQLAIIKQENIQTIVSAAPQSYQDNKLSRDNCTRAGQALLETIQAQGMTDELDQQAAVFIEKARKTVRKMNERRSPVTKLFDDIRREFTVMENAIDPTKVDTIPFKLQQLRNQYAAKKRAEEEERRRKEYERQQAEAARSKMKQDIEDDFNAQFTAFLNQTINYLSQQDNSVTLKNYQAVFDSVKGCATELPADWLFNLHTLIRIPTGVSVDELRKVEIETKERLAKKFKDMYSCEVQDNKDFILDRLPSKKANLERIAQSDAAEAARIKSEMEARQRKEAEEKEAERKRKEEEEKQKTEMARQQSEMETLFGQQSVMQQGYQPKVKVAQKINLLNSEGILPILSMWWSKEGCQLSVDELSKMFKKQIAFCEKLAKEGVFISDESVEYVEDVKAK
ncbi:MAG: hypothetical protein [Bacteriophage sp.]|nr:MAG: hypothetical protein [Bacteriophage sp.]